jgi:hypothetical protein
VRAWLPLLLVIALAGCGDDAHDSDFRDNTGAGTISAGPISAGPAVQDPTPAASPSAGLTSALADVGELAPSLESYFRAHSYPRELADVVAALPEAGLRLARGNSIGGYSYDDKAVEFVLCVQNTSGAWASYDTAPMTTAQSGESGGCP